MMKLVGHHQFSIIVPINIEVFSRFLAMAEVVFWFTHAWDKLACSRLRDGGGKSFSPPPPPPPSQVVRVLFSLCSLFSLYYTIWEPGTNTWDGYNLSKRDRLAWVRYRYFVDFRHSISVFANFSCGITVLSTPQCPPQSRVASKGDQVFFFNLIRD